MRWRPGQPIQTSSRVCAQFDPVSVRWRSDGLLDPLARATQRPPLPLADLPAPPSLDCRSCGSPAWVHAPKSSKRFLPSVKPGLLRMVAYPPNPLLREVRPAGATALAGLKSAMVRGLRYVES
jgi:hypothetical protein